MARIATRGRGTAPGLLLCWKLARSRRVRAVEVSLMRNSMEVASEGGRGVALLAIAGGRDGVRRPRGRWRAPAGGAGGAAAPRCFRRRPGSAPTRSGPGSSVAGAARWRGRGWRCGRGWRPPGPGWLRLPAARPSAAAGSSSSSCRRPRWRRVVPAVRSRPCPRSPACRRPPMPPPPGAGNGGGAGAAPRPRRPRPGQGGGKNGPSAAAAAAPLPRCRRSRRAATTARIRNRRRQGWLPRCRRCRRAADLPPLPPGGDAPAAGRRRRIPPLPGFDEPGFWGPTDFPEFDGNLEELLKLLEQLQSLFG